MRVSFHPDYRLDLPPSHPFPMGKYPLLHQLLLAQGLIAIDEVMQPDEAPLSMLARVHTQDYLDKLANGGLGAQEIRRLGVPWSARLWRRARLAVHGTYLAARAALSDGLAANLAGGTHHAFADHGEGFCVLNDVAVAIERLRAEGLAQRFIVIDLDVHQGNGTAAIFANDAEVFTLSLHGARNYPLVKPASTCDVELADGTGDALYLARLNDVLGPALDASEPQLAFYLAGVDVVAGDRYGRLALSRAGLFAREQAVLAAVAERGCPLAITLAGGYAPTSQLTAELHSQVFLAAAGRPPSGGEAGHAQGELRR